MTAPIAITGMHRSGTSMITRALHDAGLHLIGTGAEDLIDAAEDNPEGFWENKAIVACNDDLLEATGGAWDNPPDLPPQAVDDPRVAHIADAASTALAGLGEHDHWGFKDPRTCLTAAYWLDLEPELQFVVCVRHPVEVALSLKRRNQNSYSLGLALWERYYTTVLEQVPRDRRIVTHYDTYFLDPEGELARVCRFAGLTSAPPRVRTDLRHHTTGVDLGDAGASAGLQALYAELCREAGATEPHVAPRDEGRVRRLVLDGAVAQRHADQRQAAIERLEEREAELRTERDDTVADLRRQLQELQQERRTEVQGLEQQLRRRVQELEDQRRQERAALEARHRADVRELEERVAEAHREAAERLASLQRDTRADLDGLRSTLATIDRRTADAASQLDRVEAKVEKTPLQKRAVVVEARALRLVSRARRALHRFAVDPSRRVVGLGRRSIAPASRAVEDRLPPSAQLNLRRARHLARRGADDPRATAKVITRRVGGVARARSHDLPTPAQQLLRRTAGIYHQAADAPRPSARAAARRLPPSVQARLRRARSLSQQAQRASVDRRIDPPAPKAPAPPKGPPARQWMEGFEAMVAEVVPAGERWMAVVPGSPREVLGAARPRGTAVPDTVDGRALADDLGHIAQVEAQRYRGHRRLVVPEGSRPWFREQRELRDHLARSYRVLVDDEHAGLAFDLTRGPDGIEETVRGAVDRLTSGSTRPPAVLDCSGLSLRRELPDLATFEPPTIDPLPYLDGSIDVVVVREGDDDREAHRVATRGVITVVDGTAGPAVRAVHPVGAIAAPDRPSVLVWSPAGADGSWESALAERAEGDGAAVHIGPFAQPTGALVDGYDVVVAVEAGALPLPGAIATAAAVAAEHADGAIVGKVLRADGRLESAGGTVFFDRSVALIGDRSAEVRGAWHEYVRPVCWGSGLLAAPIERWRTVSAPELVEGRAFVREWCARLWATGGSVQYHPSIVAVRVEGDGGEPSTPLLASDWQRVLDLRPARPDDLSDGAWRFLLAHDDVEACRT